MTITKPTTQPFELSRFLVDIKRITKSINAPLTDGIIEKMYGTFANNLNGGAIALRATDRPGDVVNFWAAEFNRVDTVTQAIDAGLVTAENPTALLLRSWFTMYDNTPELWTDFDTAKGLAKSWVWFVHLRPLEEILSVEHVPESYRKQVGLFKRAGADKIYHVAVNYGNSAVNLYPHLDASIEQTADNLTHIVRTFLPNCPPPTTAEIEQMQRSKHPDAPIVLGVTLSYPAGIVERMCFYSFGLLKEDALNLGLGERLETFLNEVPCYDDEPVINLGWSYGASGKRYLKMDVGHCGGFCAIQRKLKHT